MEPLTFDSRDAGEAAAFVSRMYSPVHTGAAAARTDTHITRRLLTPEVAFDDLSFTFDLGFDAEPQPYLILCAVESNAVHRAGEGSEQTFGRGDLFLISRPGLPYQGVVRAARLRQLTIDPAVLTQVTQGMTGEEEPVRVLDHRPFSRQAALQVQRTMVYVRRQFMTSEALPSPLLVAAASQMLAATVLAAFPNTAVTAPTVADRRDAHPATLKRAITFIDEHAHENIAIADIAAAAHVTVRAVELAFRHYLDTTPMSYLRRVRLSHAHRELTLGDPATVSVTAVACRWGFASVSRFAAYYRAVYGVLPSQTLRA
jgi:AraC-like DNA-binding protein